MQLGRSVNRETCDAMKGLIAEGNEIVNATGDPNVKDASLIGADSASWSITRLQATARRAFAQTLGHSNVVRLLQMTLEEEIQTDKTLTELAQQGINAKARLV